MSSAANSMWNLKFTVDEILKLHEITFKTKGPQIKVLSGLPEF